MTTEHIENTLNDLLDMDAFQSLLESFSALTGIPTALLNRKGEILVASGWKRLCTDFHRKHPVTASRCLESDTVLAEELTQGESYNLYKCKNGLVDVASPLEIDNEHIGNLFIGQFLSEPPDLDHFKVQAQQFGFDVEQYLEALADIPVLSEEKAKLSIEFLVNLTRIISRAGLDRIKLLKLNQNLEQRIHDRTAELVYANERLRVLNEASFEGILLIEDFVIIEANNNAAVMFGYRQANDLIGIKVSSLVVPELCRDVLEKIASGYEKSYETIILKKNGDRLPTAIHGKTFFLEGRRVRGTVLHDLSQQRKAEEEIKTLQGILPICASCKKIRDDQGIWNRIEAYIENHADVLFSHGICAECEKQLYGEQSWYKKRETKE